MSGLAPKIFLFVEEGLDSGQIEEALPRGTRVQLARLPLADHTPLPLGDAADAELVLVACADASERALELIEAARSDVRGRPPVVVLYAGSPNGFMERAFEAGADDMITLPQPREQLSFALEKALVRKRGGASTKVGAMIAIARAEGRHGQDADRLQPRRGACGRRARRRCVVDLDLQFGDVGLALGLAPDRTIYDLAVAGGSLDAREGRRLPGASRVGRPRAARAAPSRPGGAVSRRRSCGGLRRCSARRPTSSSSTRLPAFTPEVIAAIDSSSHLCVVGDARRAVAEEHEARPRDARLRWTTTRGRRHARPQPGGHERGHHACDDVERLLGRAPGRPRSRATGTSRAASTRAADRRPPSRTRPPRRPSRRSPSIPRRAAAAPTARAARARAAAAPAPCCRKGGSTMELHERLSRTQGPDARRRTWSRRPVRGGQEPDPPRDRQRARPAALQQVADRRCCRETASSAEIRRQLAAGARPLARRPRAPRRARSPTTSSATDRSSASCRPVDHRDHGQRAARDLDRARRAPLRRRRARSSDDSHLRRIINKMVGQVGRRIDESSPMVDARLPDGIARQRDHPAAVADGAAPDDPEVRARTASRSTTWSSIGTLSREADRFPRRRASRRS